MRRTVVPALIAIAAMLVGPAYGGGATVPFAVGSRPDTDVRQLAAPETVDRSQKPACTAAYQYTQVARNAGSWDALRVVPSEASKRRESVQAEMNRIGGLSVLLEVDPKSLRDKLLKILRKDAIQILHDARITWSMPPTIRDNGVEVQIRDVGDVAQALNIFAATIAAPMVSQPEVHSVDVTDMGSGVVRLVPVEAVVAARVRIERDAAVEYLTERLQSYEQLGIAAASVQQEGAGRIRVLLSRIHDLRQLPHMEWYASKLTFRLLNAWTSPCDALGGQGPADSEVTRSGLWPMGGTWRTRLSRSITGPESQPWHFASLMGPIDLPKWRGRMSGNHLRSCSTTKSSRRRSSASALTGRFNFQVALVSRKLG